MLFQKIVFGTTIFDHCNVLSPICKKEKIDTSDEKI